MSTEERALLELSRPDKKAPDDKGGDKEQKDDRPLGVLDLLSVPAARGCCTCAFGIGTLVYTLVPAAPTYFMEVLRCDPLQTGRLLALPPIVMQATDLATGALEARMLRRGWPQVSAILPAY
jgi:hypothetical protein